MNKNILFIGMDVHKESIVVPLQKDQIRKYGVTGKLVAHMMPCAKHCVSWSHQGNHCIFAMKLGHVRRILIEAAWCYRYPAKVSREIQLRQERLPLSIRDIAWRAQLRLTQRYQHMQRKGKPHNVTVVALARELAGFMWAIANEVKYPH